MTLTLMNSYSYYNLKKNDRKFFFFQFFNADTIATKLANIAKTCCNTVFFIL